MVSRLTPSQCLGCVHHISPLEVGDGTGDVQICTAFPAGIPAEIWWNQVDHRQPVAGDSGIQFEANVGATFPAWAMAAGD